MVRAVPWDALAASPANSSDARDGDRQLLEAILKCGRVVAVEGDPESMQFVNQHLPGMVMRDAWDNHPTNAERWDPMFDIDMMDQAHEESGVRFIEVGHVRHAFAEGFTRRGCVPCMP